ncbi:MAG: hypothetical protein KAH22_03990 [Thiotrichaceae bacterium]|nr:hypothetical protein [Thiotrichaceae bacterium]
MFISKLNDGEVHILVDLMMILTMVDNCLAKQELTHLLSLTKKYDVELKFHSGTKKEILCGEIRSDCSKVIILLELIYLARVDTYFDPTEREFIENIRELFGINQEKFNEIDRWVKDSIELKERGKKITHCINPI